MTTDAIFEQLKHPNPNLRKKAMWELAENRDENTIPRLISILDQEDVTFRRAAVKALGDSSITIAYDRSRETVAESSLVVCSSGTATLETALTKKG